MGWVGFFGVGVFCLVWVGWVGFGFFFDMFEIVLEFGEEIQGGKARATSSLILQMLCFVLWVFVLDLVGWLVGFVGVVLLCFGIFCLVNFGLCLFLLINFFYSLHSITWLRYFGWRDLVPQGCIWLTSTVQILLMVCGSKSVISKYLLKRAHFMLLCLYGEFVQGSSAVS